jgi:hypothetical protein
MEKYDLAHARCYVRVDGWRMVLGADTLGRAWIFLTRLKKETAGSRLWEEI